MKIRALDHLVLTVESIDRTAKFYKDVLGFGIETFADNRTALTFGNQKINLHEKAKEFEPKAGHAVPGSADLCFLSETDTETAMAHVRNSGINIIEGPVIRTGATGPIMSFYFRDPDGNLIEVGKKQNLPIK